MSFTAFSCSNKDMDEIEISNNNDIVNIFGVEAKVVNNTLSLENDESLNAILSKYRETERSITSTRSATEVENSLSQLINLQTTDFKSLYEVYIEAIDNAEFYYERPGGYEEFKEKYDCLYFPEYKDDYSAYLPVSDKVLAKFLNQKGEIIIDNELKNMRNIKSYEKIKELGWGIPDIDKDDNDKETNTITDLTRASNYIEVAENQVVYNSGKSVKLWIDIQKGKRGSSAARFDVCFRKKGILGVWYNYSAHTWSTIYERNPLNGSEFFKVRGPVPASGNSSHDIYMPYADMGVYPAGKFETYHEHMNGNTYVLYYTHLSIYK